MSTLFTSNVLLDPEVVDTELDDEEIALLHLGTRTYFSLNVTGARIWFLLKQGRTLDEVIECLQQEFDTVDAAQAAASVEAFVQELIRNRLANLGEGSRSLP